MIRQVTFATVLWCISVHINVWAEEISTDAVPIDITGERFDCLIEPLVVIALGSPVQGVIKSLEVGRSDLVSKGQVLARLNSEVEQASLEQARVRAGMEGEIGARLADLELARQKFERIDELYSKDMISLQQRDEAKAEHQVAKMAVKQARERKKLSQKELAWATEVVKRRTIVSPIDGVVIEPSAFPGEFVYDNPIMKIAQIDPLRVEVLLPSEYYEALKLGMKAKVYPELGDTEHLSATVSIVDRMIDTGSSTFGAQLELANPDHKIASGQKCEIVFTAKDDDFDQLALAERP
ncbi:MAG: efflux RND transporter periplasmic adaptor subunit [Gammaproteobacteria bacterium]|nr:efflux RND transporter periplasmic adaptor subunit [Gammaproteobacteria bacterium]